MNTKKYRVLLMAICLLSGAVFAELITAFDFEGDIVDTSLNIYGTPINPIIDVSGNGIDGFLSRFGVAEQALFANDGHGGSKAISLNAARPLTTGNNTGFFRCYLPELFDFGGETTFVFWTKRYFSDVDVLMDSTGLSSNSGLFAWASNFLSVWIRNDYYDVSLPVDGFRIRTNGTATTNPVMLLPADGKWHFVAVRLSATEGLYIRIDEQEYLDISNTDSINACDRITFGNRDELDNTYSGEFDDIEIYRDALTVAEIEAMYKFSRKAEAPEPNNVDVGIDPTLTTISWTEPGIFDGGTLTCDVYFDDDPDISDATVLLTGSTATSATVSLAADTTYYWRVDYHDSGMAETLAGNVWSFTTQSAQASNPEPADGETGVALGGGQLSWTAALDADSYVVYISGNQAEVAGRTVTGVAAAETSLSLNAIADPVTTYYWAVDTITTGAGTVAGDVWSFTTEGLSSSIQGDLNGSGKVDFADYAEFAAQWMLTGMLPAEAAE